MRQTMPVVASVDLLAASGAYYMAAAADEIYGKPTSTIGSIGVIAFVPKEDLVIEEELITTGPYKSFGGTRDGFMRQMEVSKFSFLDAVATGRGDRLNVSTEFLSRAEVWNGSQAVEYGIIDGLLATNDALDRTAEMAGLASYETVELFDLAFPEFADDTIFNQPAPIDIDSLWQLPADMPAGIYYRYIQTPHK
jgi:protease-4